MAALVRPLEQALRRATLVDDLTAGHEATTLVTCPGSHRGRGRASGSRSVRMRLPIADAVCV